MKKTLLIFATVFFFLSCTAQRKISVAEYDKTQNFGKESIILENDFYDKFLGIWSWEQGDKKFKIRFTTTNLSFPNGEAKITQKQLEGKYDYFINGSKVTARDKKYQLQGLSLEDPNRVVFEIDNDFKLFASTIRIELRYVTKDLLRFQYVGEVSEAKKKKIPFPVGIILTREK